MAYADENDVYALGLPAAAFAARPKTIEAADVTTGVLTLTGNGLAAGTLIRFSIEGQASFGAAANALPGGLSLSQMYTAMPVSGSSDLFQVTPVGGSIITSFSSAPVGVFAIIVDPVIAIRSGLEVWSWVINDALVADDPPMMVDPKTGKYHPKLTLANANLFARNAFTSLGLANPQYKADAAEFTNGPISKMVDMWMAEWKTGVPLNPRQPDQITVPVNAAQGGNDAAPTAWLTGTL